VDERAILAIERPSPKLWTLYLARALLSGPAMIVLLPLLWFRYHTMRFKLDEEGVHMRWGLLFRREVNLTYARIQDIHLRSGLLQRWLGLADIQIQTAAGSATAVMTLEGLLEHEAVRDFLYGRMRGLAPGKGGTAARPAAATPAPLATPPAADLAAALNEVAAELRRTREALARLAGGGPA